MNEYHQPITAWAEDDRPREKLLLRGTRALSDSELIAILLRSGNQNLSAVQLAKVILSKADNKLANLSRMSPQELMQTKGVGEAKALSLIAALELGRRRKLEIKDEIVTIKTSRDAFNQLQPLIGDNDYEEFWILILNRRNQLIRKEQISEGGTSGTVVDAKRVFKKALDFKASSIILAHNHPSGSTSPSHEDKKITKRLIEAGNILDIPVLDHVIITSDEYFSFADDGLM